VPVHVTQRGNHRLQTFDRDEDYRFFLRLMGKYAGMYRNRIVGYCLMPNHFHLVVIPEEERGVSEMVRTLTSQYAKSINERLERKGHLWEDRFGSAAMSLKHYRMALAYVDLNPVRAGLVTAAGDYEWSSARAHLGAGAVPGWLDCGEFAKVHTAEEWQAILRRKEEETDVAALRQATRLGRFLGDGVFVKQMEARYGKPLERRPPGRPKRAMTVAV
jgi:putative transposase